VVASKLVEDRRWILGGLLIAAGIGLARVLTARPKIHSGGRTRLLLVGDSHAQGLTPHLKSLATDQKVPFVALSKVGTRIDQWAQSVKLDDALRDFQPTLVLVSLGTNDAYQGTGTWEKEHAAYETLLGKLTSFSNKNANGEHPADGPFLSAGAEVIWVGPPRLPPKSLTGSPLDPAFLNELANAAPNYFHSEELAIPMGPDGIHPTASGYAGWAGALWVWLT